MHDKATLHPETEPNMELVNRDAGMVHVHPNTAADWMVRQVKDAVAWVMMRPVLQNLQAFMYSSYRISSANTTEVFNDLQCHSFSMGCHPTQGEGTGCGGSICDNG
jgi:hypothetical protein